MGSGCWICETWLPVGINLGASSRMKHDGSHGALLIGGEVSLIDLDRSGDGDIFWGGYIDFTYDTGAGLVRSSLGPEVVLLKKTIPLGLDFGPLVEYKRTEAHLGGRVRLFVPLIFVVPYVGLTVLGLGERSATLEGGILLKYPIPLTN